MSSSQQGPQVAEKASVFAEFRDFLLRGNVVDLAVAVVIGAASAAVVRSLVSDLLLPLLAALIGTSDFSRLSFRLGGSVFHYGRFIDAVVSFFLIAAAIFFFVIKPTEKLSRFAREQDPPQPSEAELLVEIRDLLKRQQA